MKERKPDPDLLAKCDRDAISFGTMKGINHSVYRCDNLKCEDAILIVGTYVCDRIYEIRK